VIPVVSIENIQSLIKKVKEHKRGYLTSFFLDVSKIDLWINLHLLEYEENGETVFLCRRNQDFNNLYFATTSMDALDHDLADFLPKHKKKLFVADIVGKKTDVSDLKNIFAQREFCQYTSLVRMSRIIKEAFNDVLDEAWMTFADKKKGSEVHDLLIKYFDAYAEQLPLIEEIDTWIGKERIIIYSDDAKTVQGFLIFELIGKTSYLRYWFVHPDYREKKIGSSLLRFYFSRSDIATRQLFWVIESNANAIKRYEHFGFRKEELFDYVMINRNIHYEK
jgi:ribosomal protein S18 acetylase RimI-like enzyme